MSNPQSNHDPSNVAPAREGHEPVGIQGHRVRDPEHARAQRRAILAAAAAVFSEKGYRSATVEEIAARVEVSKPVIYYYFRNKEDLYVSVRLQETETGIEHLRQMVDEHQTPEAILRAAARDLVAGAFDPVNRAAIQLEYGGALSRGGLARIRAAQGRYRAILRSVVQQGVADGAFADGDARVAVLVFLDAVHSASNWYRPGGRLTPEQITGEVVDRVMGLLLPRR